MTNSNVEGEDILPIKKIDWLIHESGRLIIMSHIYIVESGDFLYLKHQTELT